MWDRRRRVAHLVRDRVGVKPLYYVSRASGLAFSSELRSLARSGLCLPKLDEEAVWGYLLRQFPATERTPLAGVVRLLPGHRLEWRAATGSVELERYWDFPEGGPRHGIPFERAARESGARTRPRGRPVDPVLAERAREAAQHLTGLPARVSGGAPHPPELPHLHPLYVLF